MSDDYNRGYAQFAAMVGQENMEQLTARFKAVCPDFEREVVGDRRVKRTRDGLDLKTRSLCSICVLAAQGRNNALKLNLQMALRNGASVEEICEAIFQVAPSVPKYDDPVFRSPVISLMNRHNVFRRNTLNAVLLVGLVRT